MKKTLLPLVLSLSVLLSFTGARISGPVDDDLFELKKNFEIFGALYEELVVGYVDAVRPQPFIKTGIDAMLGELDPYTRFFDQADNLDAAALRTGSQATVGLNVGMQGGSLTVLAPEGLTGGYRQGVKVGDRLLRVAGVDVSDITVRDLVVLLRGEQGTGVEMLVERSGEPEPLTFLLQRENARTSNVSYSGYLGPDSTQGIGYVRLDVFGVRSAREVRRAFRSMLQSGGMKVAVLDLRNNPGGLVSEAVELVGLFVQKGTRVVSVQGRFDEATRNYETKNDPLMPDIPLIVLVNRYSASASEIVSGALQDLDRAVVLGETTFGKGLVQVDRQLPYNTSMRITVGHYFTPGGRDIQSHRITSRSAEISRPEVGQYRTASGRPVRSGAGIEPDVLIEYPEPGELQSVLRQEGAFFQFAGEWAARAGGNAETAVVSDRQLFEAFTTWLELQKFSYRSEAENQLRTLITAIPSDWNEDVVSKIGDLESIIETEKSADFQRYESQLIHELRSEIRSRTLDQNGLIQFELGQDETAKQALDIARDLRRYRAILAP